MSPFILLFLGMFVQGPAPPAAPDALQTLITNTISTCGHNCWVQLNQTTSGPFALMTAYGYTTANFNISSNDPWTDGGGINVGSGSDGAIMSFSASGIRLPDGKLCNIATGGHAAGAVSAVFCFDVMAAATNLNGGGSGGVWTMPVKPARFSACTDTRPAWQPQIFSDCGGPAGNVGWTNTNNNSVPQQMPESCHEYWSNIWIPGTHHMIWSGYFCGFNGGSGTGGTGWVDFDTAVGTDTATVHFPTLVNANTTIGFSSIGATTKFPPFAINDLDKCLYYWNDFSFGKWCNLDSTPPTGPTGLGFDGAHTGPGGSNAVMFPKPGALTTRRNFLSLFETSAFVVWEDNGATPGTAYTDAVATLTAPVSALNTGLCYDPALNVFLATQGGKPIYQLADSVTGQISATYANWVWTTYQASPGGVTPIVSGGSGAPATCASLEPTYHAMILAIQNNVYLHVK